MNLAEIKGQVSAGKKVYWANTAYQVKVDKHGYFYIECLHNNSIIGLTHLDGKTLNGNEEDFFCRG